MAETPHKIEFKRQYRRENTIDTHVLISCCRGWTVSMDHQRGPYCGRVDHTYYPSPASRKMPSWMFFWSTGQSKTKEDGDIGAILMEVYQAVCGGQKVAGGNGNSRQHSCPGSSSSVDSKCAAGSSCPNHDETGRLDQLNKAPAAVFPSI